MKAIDRQTDNTVLKQGLSIQNKGGQIDINFLISCHMYEIQHINFFLLKQKYFTGSMPLFIPNHSHKTCGSPETLRAATTLKKCGIKTRLG